MPVSYASDPQLDFGITLLRLLSEHESSVATLADRLGLPKSLVSGWLRANSLPRPADVERIAEILDLSSAERDELKDSLFSTSLAHVTVSARSGDPGTTPRRSSA